MGCAQNGHRQGSSAGSMSQRQMRHLSVCSSPGRSIRSAAASRVRLLCRARYPSSLAQMPA
eukprot:2617127-Lingulodinium_polyedra.AAC.1